jgi:hypothetical protein
MYDLFVLTIVGGVNPAAVAAVTAGLRGNASSSQVNAQAAPSAWGSRGRPGSSAQSASKTVKAF